MDSDNKLFEQAKEVLRGGYTENARSLLVQAITLNPKHEQAWLWLSGTLDVDSERRYCLEQVIKINRDNTMAHRALEALPPGKSQPPEMLAAIATTDGIQPTKPAVASSPKETLSATTTIEPPKKSLSLQGMLSTVGTEEVVLTILTLIVIITVSYIISSAFFSDRIERVALFQTQTADALGQIALPTDTPIPTSTFTPVPTPTPNLVAIAAQTTAAMTGTGTLTSTTALTGTGTLTDTTALTDTVVPNTTPIAIASEPTVPADAMGATPMASAPTTPAETVPTQQPTIDLPPATPIPPREPLPAGAQRGYIANGGNIRSQPVIAPETVLGQVCPGDQIIVLEQQPDWTRFRVTTLAKDCEPTRVGANTEGWVSNVLVAIPSFQPAAGYPLLPPGLTPAIVTGASSGDTLQVTIAGVPDTVRMIGIDAPAPGTCFSTEATAALQQRTADRFVLLESDPSVSDRNAAGAIQRHVWLPEGRLISLDMVHEGFGFKSSTFDGYRYQDMMIVEELDAQTMARGLWAPDTCNGQP